MTRLSRTMVRSLLRTAAEPAIGTAASDLPVVPGERVGPYAIRRHLGSGGLGSVYLVERILGGAVQLGALKLLALRSTDPSFRARFEREQQILATPAALEYHAPAGTLESASWGNPIW